MMSSSARSFVGDLRYVGDADCEADAVVPVRFGGLVTLDPLHQYGRPVVRAVPTEVVAEQFRAGESTETIADLFDLTVAQVGAGLGTVPLGFPVGYRKLSFRSPWTRCYSIHPRAS
ncbi:MAG: hypothetical protein ACT4NY_31020 [Pseudonocardiales bacterium]